MMANIKDVQLKRTTKSLQNSGIKDTVLQSGEPLVALTGRAMIVGDGSTSIGNSNEFVATNVMLPVLTQNQFYYTGSNINVLDYLTCKLSDFYTITGTSVATAKGNYTITFKLKNGLRWSDGTYNDKSLSWSIVDYVSTKVSNSALSDSASKLETARVIDGVSFDGTSNITHYGRCSNETSTLSKTVSISGFSLVDGASVWVKFTNGNSGSATLNISSTGAKPLLAYDGGSYAKWIAGEILDIIYDSQANNGSGAYLVDGHALATDTVPGIVRLKSSGSDTDCAATPSMVQTKSKVYVQSTAPSSVNVGDLWINTSNGTMKYYYNGTWNSVYSVFA